MNSKMCNAKVVKPTIGGKAKYARIFVRLRTPAEVLTCNPLKDAEDFAQRITIIEQWFNCNVRSGNYLLEFRAEEITDEQADALEAGRKNPKDESR